VRLQLLALLAHAGDLIFHRKRGDAAGIVANDGIGADLADQISAPVVPDFIPIELDQLARAAVRHDSLSRSFFN